MQGTGKVYDPTTGYGVVVLDDGETEVMLAPGALKGSIFRTLRQGQRILFETTEDEGRTFATAVRLGSDGS